MSKLKTETQNRKLGKLNKMLSSLGRVVIAYSGGLDSTFLLKVAVDTLGPSNVLAVTARSETYPLSEYKEAVAIAKSIGARQLTIRTEELKMKSFRANPVNRCYYCKSELFKKLDGIKKRRGMEFVIDGTNYDDLKDVRHGRKAAKELGVRSPLLEVKMTKSDIRKFSKYLGLPTWDKPGFACLASRIPFNTAIEEKDLMRIGRIEECLHRLGFKQARLRFHDNIGRIEIDLCDFQKILNTKTRNAIVKNIKKAGFDYIVLDLEGYKTGSMHKMVAGKW